MVDTLFIYEIQLPSTFDIKWCVIIDNIKSLEEVQFEGDDRVKCGTGGECDQSIKL